MKTKKYDGFEALQDAQKELMEKVDDVGPYDFVDED